MPNANILNSAGLELPAEALRIFSTCTKSQTFKISLSLASKEVINLEFEINDLNNPDKSVTKIVGQTIEALLNQIALLNSVQNKS